MCIKIVLIYRSYVIHDDNMVTVRKRRIPGAPVDTEMLYAAVTCMYVRVCGEEPVSRLQCLWKSICFLSC